MPLVLPDIFGARVMLKSFGAEQFSDRYLRWLNDPVVNRYSQRGGQVITAEAARAYLAGLKPEENIYGIYTEEFGHIGNLKFGPLDRANNRSDLSIVVGETAAWGKGFGAEAIYLASRYAFETLKLHRIDAGSGNPAFIKTVLTLGWKLEGVMRQRVRLPHGFVDWSLLSQLNSEFRTIDKYHRKAGSEFNVLSAKTRRSV